MVIQYKTVINKEINYSDTVLSLKELGENLKITKLENIQETDLETCLKLIIEANPQVIFNTIQYSKNNKTVIFYTDQELQTKAWTDSKRKEYQPVSRIDLVLNEINKVISSSDSKINSVISLSEVIKLLKEMAILYKNTEQEYDDIIELKINNQFGSNSRIINYGYYPKDDILSIGFRRFESSSYDKINFSKHNGDLYIKSSSSLWDKDILTLLGDELSKLYDNLKALEYFKSQNKYYVQPLNSSFLIDISNYSVEIFTTAPDNRYEEEFKIYYQVRRDKYCCECNSHSLINVVKGHEDKLFEKVFVAISDCPEWMQPRLNEIRYKQLHCKNKHENNDGKDKSSERVKKRTLIRKIVTFFKK